MFLFELLCLIFIVASTSLLKLLGFKKVALKLCLYTIAISIANFVGNSFGHFLVSDFLKINVFSTKSLILEKVYSTVISAVGTLILFLILFFILKRIFAVIDGKMERTLQSVIVDRIWGAIGGLCIGITNGSSFFEVAIIVFTVIAVSKCIDKTSTYVDSMLTFRTIRNLN